ncbi:hypothetical protein [Virgibacillus senegalensis]|uniref:hypothetical protein n=1 Tax=Virgibacillus senegalensis TaxID=1499679 RepID=UPI00069E5AEF|nr:hypothetical protein [Virgibacillus senegalensis]
MAQRTLFYEKTANGFRQITDVQEQRKMLEGNHKELPQTALIDPSSFMDRLKVEWQAKKLNTDSMEKLHGLYQTLNTPQVRNGLRQAFQYVRNHFPKNFVNGVVKQMANKDFSDLLKNFSSGEDSSKLMEKVLNDPKLSKEAFGAMKDMLNDEEKFKSMTKMLSDMMNDNKDN